MSDSLLLHGLQLSRLLCLWNSQGKNTGVGYHVLLQGIFLTVHFQGELLNRFALRDRDLLPFSNFRPKIKVIRTRVKKKKNLMTDAS